MSQVDASSYLEKLFSTLTILQDPGVLRYFFGSRAFSVPCFRLVRSLRCHQRFFGTIVDVGANVGQFALAASHYFPNAQIYSFEPLPEAFSELCENTRTMKHIKRFHCALGDRNGPIPFYRNRHSRLSSSLPIAETNDHLRYREKSTFLTTVDVLRLDELGESLSVKAPVLLKMDVQGMERDVLLGSGKFLKRLDFILCEAALVSLYEGQPLFDEMHTFIKNLGYRLVAPLYLNRGNEDVVIEMDVLYARVH